MAWLKPVLAMRTWQMMLIFVVCPIALQAVSDIFRGLENQQWTDDCCQSSGLLPPAAFTPDAEVIVLASRTEYWKGIVAAHLSLVVKEKFAPEWTRFDVVGWGEPLRVNSYVADAYWYGFRPRIVYRASGSAAEGLIPGIRAAITAYPYAKRGNYHVWPGPNSNSFVAWVVRHTPGFHAELPPEAIGKDWLGIAGFDRAPSGTGYTASVDGLAGVTIAAEEGIEFHLLGSTLGIDFNDVALKLPALGKISLNGSTVMPPVAITATASRK